MRIRPQILHGGGGGGAKKTKTLPNGKVMAVSKSCDAVTCKKNTPSREGLNLYGSTGWCWLFHSFCKTYMHLHSQSARTWGRQVGFNPRLPPNGENIRHTRRSRY